jgi:hypothetical protein
MKTTIVFRLFKDKSLTELYSAEAASNVIKKFLKPWMKIKHENYDGVVVCKIDVYEEKDPGAALCDCFSEGFLVSSLEELTCLNMARSELGYYDFFEEDSVSDTRHSEKLRVLAQYMLSGDFLHTAHVRLRKEKGEELDLDKLKNNKCQFVYWLTKMKNLSKEEAIAVVDRDIPELVGVSSEFPDYTQIDLSNLKLDPNNAYEVIVKLCGPDVARKAGWSGLTDNDYDKLFNT